MRVLLISPKYHGGGAERCARELFDGLPSVGIDTTLFVARRAPDDPPNVVPVRLPGEKYLRAFELILKRPIDGRHIGSTIRLGTIRPGQFDIVHLHNLHGGWVSSSAVQKLCARFPSVWTLHDEWAVTTGLPYDLSRVYSESEIIAQFGAEPVLSPGHTKALAIQRDVVKRLPRPQTVISPSQYILDLAGTCPWFSKAARIRLPYGVTMLTEPNSNVSRHEARKHHGLPQDSSVILLVAANLKSPYKGIHYAIEAINRLTAPMHVLLVGTDSNEIAKLLKHPTVATGFLASQSDLALAYRAADVTVIPSVADNYPYVALESLSCSTPLVCFTIGGMPELAGNEDRGICCPPFDTLAMAAAVHDLLTHKDKRAVLGNTGKQWVWAHCAYDSFLKSHVRIYAETIERFREAACER